MILSKLTKGVDGVFLLSGKGFMNSGELFEEFDMKPIESFTECIEIIKQYSSFNHSFGKEVWYHQEYHYLLLKPLYIGADVVNELDVLMKSIKEDVQNLDGEHYKLGWELWRSEISLLKNNATLYNKIH